MASSSETYHEPLEALSRHTRDLHRALVSLCEELEAVDWYQQRADATADEALKAVLVHNMEEEIEHACMVLEWLRRNHAVFDRRLRDYLFKEGSITALEEAAEQGGEEPVRKLPPSTIGGLKQGERP